MSKCHVSMSEVPVWLIIFNQSRAFRRMGSE